MKRNSRLFIHFLTCVTVTCLILSFASCRPAPSPYRKTDGLTQGTFYHIIYQHDSILDDDIQSELRRFDQSLNIFDSASTISRVNDNKTTNVANDTLFLNVISRSQQIARLTNGAFDITVSPLVRLWGFNHATRHDVTKNMVDSVLQFVGFDKFSVNERGEINKKDARLQLDCNAIAQGYSCDVLSNLMERRGVKNYLIEIGGEIYARGVNPKGCDWQVGITKPVDDTTGTNTSNLQTVVAITDKAICTSGNYHKFHMQGNKKIGHEIDPRTGLPASTNLLSATVIAKDAMTADALATACMVMGLEQSVTLIQSLQEVEAYFIYLTPTGDEGFRKVGGH